jgi:hypothetical protein
MRIYFELILVEIGEPRTWTLPQNRMNCVDIVYTNPYREEIV